MLRGKKILLGVSGSIAAYKSAILTRLLVKEGAEVQVVMTASASTFITPLTLATLSKRPALQEFVKDTSGQWNNHVDLGLWADVMLIAPASANTLAKMAHGLCDNLLLACYLSARCPVFVAPAMDLDMYQHPSTLANISTLQRYGNSLIEAEHGELASGLVGQGRMAEPEHIVAALEKHFSSQTLPLTGKKALVTAGPTYEAIDPVRFIGNHSTGKMGFAIAEELSRQGADVVLVSGPSSQHVNGNTITRKAVVSAEEMYQASKAEFDTCDIVVLAAAVADYKPKHVADKKIKKEAGVIPSIELEKTTDIAASLGKIKTKQLIVGFALETDNEKANAEGKLKNKNFDLIVLNSLQDAGAGFGHDTNKITVIDASLQAKSFPLKSKKEVAQDIVHEIIQKLPS